MVVVTIVYLQSAFYNVGPPFSYFPPTTGVGRVLDFKYLFYGDPLLRLIFLKLPPRFFTFPFLDPINFL